jgi:hypothetical protein
LLFVNQAIEEGSIDANAPQTAGSFDFRFTGNQEEPELEKGKTSRPGCAPPRI